jgi:predicted CxxxxCH...CXXCH cytochrome family protein
LCRCGYCRSRGPRQRASRNPGMGQFGAHRSFHQPFGQLLQQSVGTGNLLRRFSRQQLIQCSVEFVVCFFMRSPNSDGERRLHKSQETLDTSLGGHRCSAVYSHSSALGRNTASLPPTPHWPRRVAPVAYCRTAPSLPTIEEGPPFLT